jgi:hypothetical protein
MDLSKIFPHPADVIAQDAARYRRLSVEQRLDRLFAMVEAGQTLLSPQQRQIHQQLKTRAEVEWQVAQAKVAARHE